MGDCYLHLQGLQVKINSDSHMQKWGYYIGKGEWRGKPIGLLLLCSRGSHRCNTQEGEGELARAGCTVWKGCDKGLGYSWYMQEQEV